MGRVHRLLQPVVLVSVGRSMLNHSPGLSIHVEQRRFRALLVVSPLICAQTRNLIGMSMPQRAASKHLLWALVFLKCYAMEHTNRIIAGCDEKTV